MQRRNIQILDLWNPYWAAIDCWHYKLMSGFFSFPQYFQKEMPQKFEADQEAIFSMAFGLKINQKKMKRLEKEYTTMKCKEKEDEIELRVSLFLFLTHVWKVENFLKVTFLFYHKIKKNIKKYVQ